MRIQPRSLQQRTLLYILLPTFILLLALSFFGFVFVRNILVEQWGTAAVSKLQHSADLIDAQLREPKKLLSLLQAPDGSSLNRRLVNHLVSKIEELDSVATVIVEWPDDHPEDAAGTFRSSNAGLGEGRGRLSMRRYDVSSPTYDKRVNSQAVSLVSEFRDADDATVGRVEVVISFDALIDRVIKTPWWKSNKAFLLDGSNNVLTSTGDQLGLEDYYPMRAFGTMSVLEKDTLEALKVQNSGTVFGPGKPPEEISGFYHLSEAPWTMVIIAPGKQALQPIIQFRRLYIGAFIVSTVCILFFIRLSMNRVTTSIKQISHAAGELANGTFGPPLAVTSRDEVGELTRNFNEMTRQLKQRLELKAAINVAREVQQNLLPRQGFSSEGVEISGMILYCDETGGDYYDILRFDDQEGKVGVVVGDVVGHGVGAALLMTTVRALIRSGTAQPGDPAQMMDIVNRLLFQDTAVTGSFVTLFYLEIDYPAQSLRWVRAGHDPAMVVNLESGEHSELRGEGLALGIDRTWRYEFNELPLDGAPLAILIGSDGAWEVMNERGEQFGKERFRKLFSGMSGSTPEIIVQAMLQEIKTFAGKNPPADDITLAVIRID